MLERPDIRPQRARDEREYHSVEECIGALRDLGAEGHRRLGLQAESYARRAGCEARDLVHEAVAAAAAGERRWPVDVPLRTFLRNAMRSIASNRRRKEKRFESFDDGHGDHAASSAPTPEESDDEKLTRWENEAFAAIGDDDEAGLLFMSRLKGQDAAAFRAEYGLSQQEHETISRRLHRKLRHLNSGAAK